MKLNKLILVLLLFIQLYAQKIELNFRDLSLYDFVKLVAKITNKNILVTKNLTGKVNFIAIKPVSKEELYSILLEILKSRGYTLINTNGYLSLVSLNEGVKLASLNKTSLPELKTIIIRVNNISLQEAKNQIKNFLSNAGKIITPPDKDYLIITDFPTYLQKIRKFLKYIDQQNKKSVEFIKIKYVSSTNLLSKLKALISNVLPKDRYQLINDNISNSIIVIANKTYIDEIKKFISKLDVKPVVVDKKTEIFRIKNADVKDIYKVISTISKSKFKKNPPIITLDSPTNSLIVVGDKDQRDIISSIVKALDVPREQVYIKVRILEISNNKLKSLGSKLGILGGSASTSGLYTFSANLGGPALAFDPAQLGLDIPTIQKGLALGATFDLLETTGAAKKLSEPSILCINNTPATLYVGKTVSVITQSTVGATTTDVTKNTYSRQDIGLKLSIKPRIDIDNKVAIKVKGVIEDLLPGSQVGLPTTSKREIDTSTIVRNGQSIIIGGLIRDNSDITVQKVPLLGDIPILGALFRHIDKNKDKTTIVIVMTPYIVKTSDDLSKLRNLLVKLNLLESKFVEKVLKNEKNK